MPTRTRPALFSILGDHTYATADANLVTITVDDLGGATAAAVATVIVSANETLALPTNTALSSGFPSGSPYGQTVAVTATVGATGATGATPAGSVDFVDQSTGQDLGVTLLAIVNGVARPV